MARAMKMLLTLTQPQKLLSIQVDGIYVQAANRNIKTIEDTFKTIQFNQLRAPKASWSNTLINQSEQLVYNVQTCDPKTPGGTLKIVVDIDTQYIEPLTCNSEEVRLIGSSDI